MMKKLLLKYFFGHTDLIDQDPKAKAGIWKILCDVDEEFVPPLSSRGGPKDKSFDARGPLEPHPHEYFQRMKLQPSYFVEYESEMVAFLAYVKDYNVPEIDYCVSRYVSTIGVSQDFRRKGLARKLYENLIEDVKSECSSNKIVTRTWSSNTGHINLLKDLGFELVATKKSARSQNIDTVIYSFG